MQTNRKSPQTYGSMTASFILLVLATPLTILAADLTPLPGPITKTLDKQIDIQPGVETSLGQDGANIILGAQASGNGSGDQRASERRVDAEANASRDSEGRTRAHIHGQGHFGTNSDGIMAPVPEPSTWIGLGTLLVMGLALLRLENRKKSLP